MAKVYRKEQAPKFVPVILELETQNEVDALYALLNHAWLGDALQEAPTGNPLAGLWSKTRTYTTGDSYVTYLSALEKAVHNPSKGGM